MFIQKDIQVLDILKNLQSAPYLQHNDSDFLAQCITELEFYHQSRENDWSAVSHLLFAISLFYNAEVCLSTYTVMQNSDLFFPSGVDITESEIEVVPPSTKKEILPIIDKIYFISDVLTKEIAVSVLPVLHREYDCLLEQGKLKRLPVIKAMSALCQLIMTQEKAHPGKITGKIDFATEIIHKLNLYLSNPIENQESLLEAIRDIRHVYITNKKKTVAELEAERLDASQKKLYYMLTFFDSVTDGKTRSFKSDTAVRSPKKWGVSSLVSVLRDQVLPELRLEYSDLLRSGQLVAHAPMPDLRATKKISR